MWNETKNGSPENDRVVETKIDDHDGVRNVQKMKFKSNLWWLTDMSMYVYYTPTHWRYA